MIGTAGASTPVRDASWLCRALDTGRMVVHYQPIVTLPERRVLGVEALVRVRDDQGALLRPGDFLPLAGEPAVLARLDGAVLEEALDAVALWRRQPELSQLYVAVNVAPTDLVDRRLPDRIEAALRRRGLPASALLIEVVESDLVGSTAVTYETIEALAGLGLRIALDDFGTGFATLENLHRLPISMIKIDRLFVAGMGLAGTDDAIVRAVIDLADALEITVVAEGVETEQQEARLVSIGCPAGQGWLFAEPQAAAGLEKRLLRPPTDATASTALLRWTTEQRAGAVACARVLSMGDPKDRHRRALAYAIAMTLATNLRLPPAAAEDAALLTLLADADRLGRGFKQQAQLLDRLPGVRSLLGADRLADPLLQVRVAAVSSGIAERALSRADIAALAQTAADQLAVDDRLTRAVRLLASDSVHHTGNDVDRLLDTLAARSGGRESVEGRFRGLAALAQVMASLGSYREVVALAAEEARRTLGAASVSVSRFHVETDTVRTLCNVGHLGPNEERFPDDEVYDLADFPVATRLFTAGLPLIQNVDDDTGDPTEQLLLREFGKGSCAAVPITVDDRLWGELYATTLLGAPAFSNRDVELLTACASFLGAAVAHAERLERIARLAFEDPLTGLANRRAVDDALAAALEAGGAGAALVVVDVNAFKAVNDEHGHTVGDRVLQAVGSALAAAAAPYEQATVGRVGGDEFCVVLPGVNEDDALAVVESAAMRLTEAPEPKIRIAGGVALGVPGSRPQQLFMAADAAQYSAKRARMVVVSHRVGRSRPTQAPERRPRRLHRNGAALDWRAVLEGCTSALAGLGPYSSVADRLQVVADVLCETADLGRWALSHAGTDEMLRCRRIRVHREPASGDAGRDLSLDAGVYRLEDFPVSQHVVRHGGTFYVHVRDPRADPAERDWLRSFALTANLAVGVPDGDGGWLLELFADGDEPIEDLRPVVDLVALLCRR